MRKKQPPGTITVTVDEQYFGTVCICAIRYVMGRETYMPSLVRDFVRPLLPVLPDKTIGVMINDCEIQANQKCWGSETIDKPGWVKWRLELLEERERRNRV